MGETGKDDIYRDKEQRTEGSTGYEPLTDERDREITSQMKP